MESSGFLLAFALCLSSADICSVRVFVTISTLLAPKTLKNVYFNCGVLEGGGNLAVHPAHGLHPLASPSKETTFSALHFTLVRSSDFWSLILPPDLFHTWKLMLSVSRKVWIKGVESLC